MSLKRTRIVAGLAMCLPTSLATCLTTCVATCLAACLAACGAPGWSTVCNARCDALLRCKYQSTSEATLCHTDCNSTKVTASDLDLQLAQECKNSGDIRSQQLRCYDSTCLPGKDDFEVTAGDCLDSAQATQCKKP
jgi:hypothetical protein